MAILHCCIIDVGEAEGIDDRYQQKKNNTLNEVMA